MSSKAPAGLTYVHDDQPGISRLRSGKGFRYSKGGRALRDKKTLERIRKLAIPPAWAEVWICANENGHLQATGRDARGRKQHRYHPRFREHQESAKFDHVAEFAKGLPAIRRTINTHMRKKGLPREKVGQEHGRACLPATIRQAVQSAEPQSGKLTVTVGDLRDGEMA